MSKVSSSISEACASSDVTDLPQSHPPSSADCLIDPETLNNKTALAPPTKSPNETQIHPESAVPVLARNEHVNTTERSRTPPIRQEP